MELMVGLYFCGTFEEFAALAENAPKPSSARKTPARTINRPIKMRGSRNANCETDFFSMGGMVWIKFGRNGHLLAVRMRSQIRRAEIFRSVQGENDQVCKPSRTMSTLFS
jgi:hypothetical protein